MTMLPATALSTVSRVPAHDEERHRRRGDRGEEGHDDGGHVVQDRNRQVERQHPDVVHRPDAEAHRAWRPRSATSSGERRAPPSSARPDRARRTRRRSRSPPIARPDRSCNCWSCFRREGVVQLGAQSRYYRHSVSCHCAQVDTPHAWIHDRIHTAAARATPVCSGNGSVCHGQHGASRHTDRFRVIRVVGGSSEVHPLDYFSSASRASRRLRRRRRRRGIPADRRTGRCRAALRAPLQLGIQISESGMHGKDDVARQPRDRSQCSARKASTRPERAPSPVNRNPGADTAFRLSA